MLDHVRHAAHEDIERGFPVNTDENQPCERIPTEPVKLWSEDAADDIPTPVQATVAACTRELVSPASWLIREGTVQVAVPPWCGARGCNATSVVVNVRHDRCHVPDQQPRFPNVTEEEPEGDEEIGTEDSAPDVRYWRPDVQPEPKKPGIPDDSVIGRSDRSLTVSEPAEGRVTTENTSSDMEDTSAREQLARS